MYITSKRADVNRNRDSILPHDNMKKCMLDFIRRHLPNLGQYYNKSIDTGITGSRINTYQAHSRWSFLVGNNAF